MTDLVVGDKFIRTRLPGRVYTIAVIYDDMFTATFFNGEDSQVHIFLKSTLATDDIMFIGHKDSLCIHEYKTYVGFTQAYNYCIGCDKKESI